MFPEWYQAVVGASESVEILAPRYTASGVDPTLVLDVGRVADSRLERRALVGYSSDPYLAAKLKLLTEELSASGWEVIRTERRPPFAAVIVDSHMAYVVERSQSAQRHTFRVDDPKDVSLVKAMIDDLRGDMRRSSVILDQDSDLDAETASRLTLDWEAQWSALFNHLKRNPSLMYEMPSRKFEEMVAELLTREGLQVTLTPATRDGGRDILAFAKDVCGTHLYLVECKRYSKDNPIGVDIVRRLYGVVELERATGGLLVTSSRLTSGSLDMIKAIGYRVNSREYDDLVEWIKRKG